MNRIPQHNISLWLLMAALAAMFFFSFGTDDVTTWLRWMRALNENGIIAGYQRNDHDYPPLMSVLVYTFTSIADSLSLPAQIGFKFLLLVFLTITTVMIYHGLQKDIQLTFSFYLALLFSALCLAYVDICLAPFLLLFCYFLHKQKIAWAVFCFTLACLLKFSPLIIAPFIAIYLVMTVLFPTGQPLSRASINSKQFILQVIAPAALLLLPLFIFFGSAPIKALSVGATHTYLSANALNFNWVVTRCIQLFLEGNDFVTAWQHSAQFITTPPYWSLVLTKTLFIGFYFSSLWIFFRREKNAESLLVFCILGHMAYFMFNTGVHENHLFVACILAIALTCLNKQYQTLALSLCFISSLNMFAFYGYNGEMLNIWPEWYVRDCIPDAQTWCSPPIDYRLLIAVCNTVYFLHLWFSLIFLKTHSTHQGQTHD